MTRMRWRRDGRLMFVTGGSGFVGRHLVARASEADWQVVAPPSTSLDIVRGDSVTAEIANWKPTTVVHLAYRKGDRLNIVQGSRNVARAAAAVGAHLVHLSTDVVFGGRPEPYTEWDPPSPIEDYGRDKTDAEAAVAAVHPTAVLVRTSLVYGTHHLAVPQLDVQRVLARQSSMRFFTDEVRCPVHGDDLADAVIALACRRDVTGPLHVAGPEPVSRATLARSIARWLGAGPEAEALPTGSLAELGLNRPGNLVLDVSRAAGLGITCRPVSHVLRT